MNDDESIFEGVSATDVDDIPETEENILLYTLAVGPRVFVLNNSSMTNVLGLALDETEDSFLVGLPAILKDTIMGALSVESFTPTPYFRLLKSSVISVMYIAPPVDKMYEDYVDKKGSEIYPDLGAYMDIVNQDEPSGSVEPTPIVPGDTDVSLTADEEGGNKVQGLADEDLKKYLMEKFATGNLAKGPKKKQ